MAQSPREIVTRCLEFKYPQRVPQDIWILPGFTKEHPEVSQKLIKSFPSDIEFAVNVYNPSEKVRSNPYDRGEFVDEWGCVFKNVQPGIIGEVKEPMVKDISDWSVVEPPYNILPEDYINARDKVNRFCETTSGFVIGPCALSKPPEKPPFKSFFNVARPWERYQFLRGTQNAMMELLDFGKYCKNLLKCIHDFYLKEMEFWVSTKIDAVWFMDDWGSQKQLMIPPSIWRDIFKPMYKDYCDLAHSHGKFVFMHSDGYIIDIYEDLIEIGVNAINSQIFCMDMEQLAKQFKGRITFWGEIDRQHIMPNFDPQKGRDAVRKVVELFYDPSGGIIAQASVEPGANTCTAQAVFKEWHKIQDEINVKERMIK